MIKIHRRMSRRVVRPTFTKGAIYDTAGHIYGYYWAPVTVTSGSAASPVDHT